MVLLLTLIREKSYTILSRSKCRQGFPKQEFQGTGVSQLNAYKSTVYFYELLQTSTAHLFAGAKQPKRLYNNYIASFFHFGQDAFQSALRRKVLSISIPLLPFIRPDKPPLVIGFTYQYHCRIVSRFADNRLIRTRSFPDVQV